MDRPNILLIHSDQHRWDALGVNGNDEVRTPNLDALAEDGVNFDRYFVQNPVCAPSRQSYLTGRYPSQLGIYQNGVRLPEDELTLPRMLKRYGYRSANLGKLHFIPHSIRDHRAQHPSYGFDRLELSEAKGVYDDDYHRWVKGQTRSHLDKGDIDDLITSGAPKPVRWGQRMHGIEEEYPEREGNSFEPDPFEGGIELTHSAFVADRTIEFLQDASSDPFLCVAGFHSPHFPFLAPEELLNRYDPEELSIPDFPEDIEDQRDDPQFSDHALREAKWGYYALISEVDHFVGEILDALAEEGLAENTVIVFTSDHGEFLGEHLRFGKADPGYDCITRVPFIVRWPAGIASPGRTVRDIVEAVDLVPTLLDISGCAVPRHLPGQSIRSALDDETYERRKSALMQGPTAMNIRTDQHRYVLWDDGTELLFDMREDPREYDDLSDDPEHAETLSKLRYRLACRLTDAVPELSQEGFF